MRRTLGLPLVRAGTAALLSALVLLCQPGTALAGETTQDRPPLARGAGYETGQQPWAAARVAALQRQLRRLGWKPGPIDGLFGPRTEAAVRRCQQATGIAVDGIVGIQTRRKVAWALERLAVRRAAYLSPDPVPPVVGRRVAATPRPGAGTDASFAEDEVDAGLMLAITLPALLSALLAAVLGGRGGSAERSRTEPVPGSHAPSAGLAALPPGPPSGPDEQPGRRAESPLGPVRAIGYVSVPAEEPRDGPMMQEQTEAIGELCELRHWSLVELVHDVERERCRSTDRPGLAHALERLAKREATCLVVSALPRLSPSAADLGRILGSIGRSGGRFVALDDGIDTADPAGRKAANLLVRVGAWERDRVGEQTRKGLAVVRAQGGAISRPSVQDVPALKQRITGMRARGMTLQAIADRLNEEGVPTLRGGREWRPSSVQSAAGYRRPRRG